MKFHQMKYFSFIQPNQSESKTNLSNHIFFETHNQNDTFTTKIGQVGLNLRPLGE